MSELFLNIVNRSISASWVVIAVLVLRFCLKKAPKWVSVLLWGIVAVRLVFPFSIESALSLIPSAETIRPTIMMEQTPSVQTGVPALNQVINPVIGGSFTPAPGASANPLQIWIPVFTGIWLFGVAILFLYSAVSYWRLRRKVCEAVILRDNIYQSEKVCSPFVLGIVRPKIYLPYHMERREMDPVIAHEQTHIRRKDHWWKPLGFLLLTIHWFNPLMWLSYILLCRDIELACDEKVIRDMGNEQRADYTQALVACSVNRRSIAACPLAFGEVGVKARVKSVMNYKKPAFWIVLASVILCAVIAVCFLTDPVEFQFDAATTPVVSAKYFDARNADDPVTIEMTPAQISELNSRLAGVKNCKRSDKYAGLTPGYQISARLQDGSYIRISGYHLSDSTMVDIEQSGKRYTVSDKDFQDYLSRVCAGEDVAPAQDSHSTADNSSAHAELWFDYLGKPDEMNWDGNLEIDLPGYPGVTFRWYPEKMEAVTENEVMQLYTGMPIWNTYFCDLTGDGLPELCSTLSFGSGIIDSRIIVYDYANGVSYTLEDRGEYDYSLRPDETDGCLWVVKKAYNGDVITASGKLLYTDNCLRVAYTLYETHKFTSVTIRNDGEDTLHITIGSDEKDLPAGEETTLTYTDFALRTIKLSSFGELHYTVAYD